MYWEKIIDDTEKYKKKVVEINDLINKNFLNSTIGLIGGTAGIVIFKLYASSFLSNKKIEEEAFKLLAEIFKKLNNDFRNPTFAGGFSGILWLLNFMERNNFTSKEIAQSLNGINEYLFAFMRKFIIEENFDFLYGALGIANSFINIKNIDKGFLESFISMLYEKAEIEDNQLGWKTLLDYRNRTYGYNFGLAHGIPSFIGVLINFIRNDILVDKCTEILLKAINFLTSYAEFERNTSSVFPNWIDHKDPQYNSRLAWCYGDLGIGMTLWRAGNILKKEQIIDFAQNLLARTSSRRDLKENFVVDAGLCHGTAGIAHIFNRMYQNTKTEEFKEAAIYWFNETLNMAKFGDGLAGFKTFKSPEFGGWQNNYGLLEGISGIGLALISSISNIEPRWDECLLLS